MGDMNLHAVEACRAARRASGERFADVFQSSAIQCSRRMLAASNGIGDGRPSATRACGQGKLFPLPREHPSTPSTCMGQLDDQWEYPTNGGCSIVHAMAASVASFQSPVSA